MKDFKYDIAFSFLSEDEAAISPLNDLLKDRLKTFFFPERQREVVGTDGEKTFSKVFQSETRMAVIIYRAKWGTTDWTRIEQTAIRNRGFDETYEFALLIPMEKPVTLPLWFPKQHIWFDLDRLRINGAAAVIEQRVRELGGLARPETIEDTAERIRQEIQFRNKRESYLLTKDALDDAKREALSIFAQIKEKVSKLNVPQSHLSFKISQEYDTLDVMSWGFILRISWYNGASNMLHESVLAVQILEINHDRFEDRLPPTIHEDTQYDFDLNFQWEHGWTKRQDRDRFFLSSQIAEAGLRMFLKYLGKPANKKRS
jgi:hypothetical protein